MEFINGMDVTSESTGSITSAASSDKTSSSPGKRRAAKACDLCHQRKVKCDEKVPCSNCIKHNAECVYINRKRGLSTKVKMNLAQLFSTRVGIGSDGSGVSSDNVHKPRKRPGSSFSVSAPASPAIQSRPIFATGGFAEDSGGSSKSGSKSNESFTDKLHGLFTGGTKSNSSLGSKGTVGSRSFTLSPARSFATEDHQHIDIIVDYYFLHLYEGNPIFHESTFKQAVRERKVPSHLLSSLMAYTCKYAQVTGDLTFISHKSVEIYNKAKDNLKSIIEDETIASVQSMILLALCACLNGELRQAKLFVSMTVTSCVGLTLNIDPNDIPVCASLCPLEKEMRRRIWWLTYVLDRTVAFSTMEFPNIDDMKCAVSFPMPELVFRSLDKQPRPSSMYGVTLHSIHNITPEALRPKIDVGSFAIALCSFLGRLTLYLKKVVHSGFDQIYTESAEKEALLKEFQRLSRLRPGDINDEIKPAQLFSMRMAECVITFLNSMLLLAYPQLITMDFPTVQHFRPEILSLFATYSNEIAIVTKNIAISNDTFSRVSPFIASQLFFAALATVIVIANETDLNRRHRHVSHLKVLMNAISRISNMWVSTKRFDIQINELTKKHRILTEKRKISNVNAQPAISEKPKETSTWSRASTSEASKTESSQETDYSVTGLQGIPMPTEFNLDVNLADMLSLNYEGLELPLNQGGDDTEMLSREIKLELSSNDSLTADILRATSLEFAQFEVETMSSSQQGSSATPTDTPSMSAKKARTNSKDSELSPGNAFQSIRTRPGGHRSKQFQ
ncbi:hypothetical protein MP638_004060 [Amoeboaphelidium occidentale]|nr:hypothetical protein MP638_004060 [Amoeboaphelidium occidentale]